MMAARRTTGLAGGLLVVLTLAAYVPAMRGGFIWDDDSYVTRNQALRSVDGLRQVWFEIGATPQYYPLVFTAFWAEYHLWGLHPAGYHIVNVLLHTGSALVLWAVLRRLAVPGAWLAAAVFALHPVHVESVAWVAERKNVLSGVFYLLAVLAYARFSHLESSKPLSPRAWRFYAAAFVLFVCALLSKTVTCTLPAAILLLLWWKRNHLGWRDVLPLVPMFLVGAAMGLMTAWLEERHVGAEGEEWSLPFAGRWLLAGRIVWFYAGKLLCPVNLTFIYPRWHIDSSVWWQYLGLAGVLGVIGSLWLLRGRVGKAPLVAVLFFVGTLTPALGFFNVYPMRYSFVADHFQYLASIGPIAIFAASVVWSLDRRSVEPQATRKADRRSVGGLRPSLVASAGVLAILAVLTWRQGGIYKDVERLWRDTLVRNPSCWMAHGNLGDAHRAGGRAPEAIQAYVESLRLKLDQPVTHYHLGLTLADSDRLAEAKEHYLEAIRLKPDLGLAHDALGVVLARNGDFDGAARCFAEAVRLLPTYPDSRYKLGLALARQGRLDEAIKHYIEAIQLRPVYPEAHHNVGLALARRGDLQEAVKHLRECLRSQPYGAAAHRDLGDVLATQGRLSEAAAEYGAALRLRPGWSEVSEKLQHIMSTPGDR